MRKYWNLAFTFLLLSFNKDVTSSEVGELSLPQNDEDPQTRQDEIDEIAGQIKNELRVHMVDEVPYDMNFGPKNASSTSPLATELINLEYYRLLLRIREYETPKAQAIFGIAISFFNDITSVDDYTAMYDAMEAAGVVETPRVHGFDDDFDFGEDRLTFKFNRLSLVKDYVDLGLTDQQIREVCGGGTVEALFTSRRVYKQDFSFAADYNDPDAFFVKYVPSVIGYFCINDDEKFVPVSIHIVDGLKYSKFDSAEEWQLAKMALNAAGNEVQQFDHFIQTHLNFDPLRVALLRNVHCTHPIYNLLDHHLFNNFAIAYFAFDFLISKGTPLDIFSAWGAKGSSKFVSDELQEPSFRTLSETIEDNGLQRLRGLSKHIGDAERHLMAIRKFVRSHLKRYYIDPDDITDDTELHAWLSETSLYVQNFPSEVNDLKELVELISNIIFQLSVRHHAINSDTTWHCFSFPYSLFALYAPLPASKGDAINLFDYMPPNDLMAASVALVSNFLREQIDGDTLLNNEGVLSYELNDVNLGMESDPALENYQLDLFEIDTDIEVREQNSLRPYDLMRPKKLPHYSWI